jgi:elongator complex protein 6
MSARLPHLLEPYLALPPETSLILLTSVLGASSNWLTLRYLYSYLKSSSSHPSSSSNENITAVSGGTGVVLVSFMRDGAFWRDGAGRMGLDLDAAARSNRFVFIDGLTGLFSGDQAKNPGMGSSSGRLGDGNPKAERILRSSRLADVQAGINAALAQLQTSRKILVIDQIDALLAASEEDVTSAAVSSMLLSLREVRQFPMRCST